MFPSLYRQPAATTTPAALGRDLDHLFNEWLSRLGAGEPTTGDGTATYPVDIREDDGRVLVDAELPGFDKDEVDVNLEQGILNITAEHKEEKQRQKEKGQPYLNERRYRRVERSFTLPAAVDESNVEAKLDNGVLHLELQKTEKPGARKIEVK